MADIVHEAQDTHLCALFIGAHGDTGDYEYALDAANSGECPILCVRRLGLQVICESVGVSHG